jgi:hypothetical protein
MIPIIAVRTRLELRAEHSPGGSADDAAGNGAAGLAGRSAADDRSDAAANDGATGIRPTNPAKAAAAI